MNEKEFFEVFDAERWNFTFMDEMDTTKPVQQVGLVAVFYLVDAYLPLRRKHIAEALKAFFSSYGEKLTWGFVLSPEEKMIEQACDDQAIKDCLNFIENCGSNVPLSFRWSSNAGYSQSSDYLFAAYSPAGWFEKAHNDMTCIRIYLPVEVLKGAGHNMFEAMLSKYCAVLRPLHGAAGLGVQECFEWEDFQHTEYETAWAYRGIDICGPFAPKTGRSGYRSLNWYTFLAHHWLDRLGTPDDLKAKLDDERIAVIPYEWGSMIRAGDWPQLGKADVDSKPELYVKVNEAIKPLRVDDIGSLHYGSLGGEVRFNRRTSNLWLRRFDTPPSPATETTETAPLAAKEETRQFFRIASGTPCPWPGVWQCEDAEHLGPQTIAHGVPMPEIDGRAVTWRLVKAL
ncbi:type VI immunity family protein [Paraburkholderia tropica]|uniref:type VI immunity family protein n=2 Tax=Paraburkholderia tropica TaxID=92647 RepID=UPI002AB24ECB|nr:type VI immunity family protein [Paraburkholderia tropica]